jgi:hypothetical protein
MIHVFIRRYNICCKIARPRGFKYEQNVFFIRQGLKMHKIYTFQNLLVAQIIKTFLTFSRK